jgi:hypothetical protein
MRIFRTILIVIVLIGLPALSWVYLSSGLKWRVRAQNETVSKQTLADFALIDRDSNRLSSDDLIGIFYVVATPDDSLSLKHLNMVHEQFHVREDYRTMFYESTQEMAPVALDTTWMYVRCVTGCDTLQKKLFDPDYSAAIVDDSLHIRGRYHLSSLAEMRKLVEHLAVVLPIERRERIELKRGNQ